ncbi:MAG: PQQ-binding-like beta-propeller repeat protein [Polyangiaceae bacterium]|nr:PQQ-binding-like beta-propeller repeat protein [Polyangiaceae bacterium]
MRPRQAPLAPALTLVLALFTGACGTLETGNDRVNPEQPLWFHRPSGALRLTFSRPLTAQGRVAGEAVERGRPEIDARSGRVFVGSSDSGLYALRAGDGSTLWRFETLASVQSEPLYDPELDVVYFGSNDGALYAVHASDGHLVWRFASGAEVARRPVRVGEALYFTNAADTLVAVDRRSGREAWRIHRTPALGMEISGYAGAAYDRGAVFFASSDGHVGAYDARDGNERWPPVDLSAEAEQTQGSEALRYLDVDTTPVPDDLGSAGHVIFVASYAGGVFALDADRGGTVWRDDKITGVTDLYLWREPAHSPNPGSADFVPGGPPVPQREILFASSGGALTAIDPPTGHVVWRIPVPEGGVTAPASLSGALLVGTSRYGAFLLAPRNGRALDGIDLGTGFSQTPATVGDRAYILTNGGTLVAVSVAPPIVRNAPSPGF